ncbi:MAG: export transporter permease LptF, partial [Pseudomonadota bacterium]
RTLQRDLIFYSTAVYAGLVLITLTFTLIKLLTQAGDDKIDPQSVSVLLGFAIINFQALMLSLSIFMGTLLVYSRMWRDSEMVVWQSSGLSLYQFIAPTIEFSLPVALLAALFGLLIAPWANQQAYQYRDNFVQRQDISRIAAQQFKESSDGSRVFYVGTSDERSRTVNNVFILEKKLIHSTPSSSKTVPDLFPLEPISGAFIAENIVAAAQGRVYTSKEGEQYLELNQGRRYQLPSASHTGAAISAETANFMQFDQYRTLLATPSSHSKTLVLPAKQRSSSSLLIELNAIAQAELTWRISGALMCIILAMLAVPLSYFNPRSGKSTPLVMAVLIFIVYVNAINLAEDYLQLGKITMFTAIVIPHGLILLLSWGLLLLRNQSLRPFVGQWRKWVSKNSVK